jgi:histidinol-phosphate aminotransferase
VADHPGLVLLDSPHNVTGTTVPLPDIVAVAAAARPGTVVVYDNVYGEYQDTAIEPEIRDAVDSGLPIIVARSFSKAHRLFGLRVGYLIAAPAILHRFGPIVLRYDVGTLAQRAAAAAIRDRVTVHTNQLQVADARHRLYDLLDRSGLAFVPSQSAGVLVDAGDRVEQVELTLRRAGCPVRGPNQHGLPGHLQIVIDDARIPDRVEQALAAEGSPAWTSS